MKNARAYAWGPSFGSTSTRFRLWAPRQRNVKLRLGREDIPMVPEKNGWFTLDIPGRPSGDYWFMLDDGTFVPDPASRQQTGGVLGASTLVDPDGYPWKQNAWRGRRWEEAIFYELHIGAFTKKGTYLSAINRLGHLAEMGFTAIEVMPIAEFPGERGWGYDGVYTYAPYHAYGRPDDFKAFVDAAHSHGLMIFLDVVYNHFGPIGNSLPTYASEFFREGSETPWGAQIAFEKTPVRRFFIENALYWLEEFRLDGLRFDAVDHIVDPSQTHFLVEMADEIRKTITGRHVHLVVENPASGTDLIAPMPNGMQLYKADWNDDFHHALHVAVTGEIGKYLEPFVEASWEKARGALAEGYLFDGKRVLNREPVPTSALAPTSFVHFLQNHDQVGNRARGDRLHQSLEFDLYRAMVEVVALSPQIPLFFMGDDHLSQRGFRFFADFTGDLRQDVWKNRATEARNFSALEDGFSYEDIPDPSDLRTFQDAKLDWAELLDPAVQRWKDFLRMLLSARARYVVPVLDSIATGGSVIEAPEGCLFIDWEAGGRAMQLRANLSSQFVEIAAAGEILYPPTRRPQLIRPREVFLLQTS